MQKKELYFQLQQHISDYKKLHNRTADLDFMIARQFARGKNTVQIAMDIPCGEATVYRAVNCMTSFLSQKNKPCQPAGLQPVDATKKA